MFSIEKDAQKAYSLLKRKAKDKKVKGDYEHSWKALREGVSLILMFNWEYSDIDLERVLQGIAAVWLPIISKDFRSVNDRVVVVDDWCTSYVLVLQYIEALVEAGKDVFYITSRDPAKVSRGSILNRVEELSNVRAFSFPYENTTPDEWCRRIYQEVIAFSPAKVVAHIGPCSPFLCVLARLPKEITRYRSNLDDQCFWLGTSAIDYSLEFRPFGVTVSHERRGLKPEQQLYVPFYPVHDGNTFQGFPELPSGSVKIFSGGDFYKTLDPAFTYWGLVKRILQDNPSAILLYATKNIIGKTTEFLDSFIKDNHLERQFFYIGFRPDIWEAFAHSDIFLGTCPVCGSLMSQLAATNRKPILQFYLPGTDDDETEQAVCYNNPGLQVSFTDEDAFLAEARHLVSDAEYRREKGEQLHQSTMSREQFNKVFIDALETNQAPCPTKPVNFKEVQRRWWWPEELGFYDTLSYLYSTLKKERLLYRAPIIWFKFNWRRFFSQKLLSPDWYRRKFFTTQS